MQQPEHVAADRRLPQTRPELQAWVHEHLGLDAAAEAELLDAIDGVFSRHERLWQ
jgi:hypothetical protein